MRPLAAVGLAFGVMKATDAAKELFTRTTGQGIQPYVKSTFAIGASVVAAVAYERTWRERVLLASTVAGCSALLHEAYGVLTTASDKNKAAVLTLVARNGATAAGRSAPGRRVSQPG